ncbi:hypothetical protein ISN45_Un144g000020 [Arabidopsis thaliana x Arabidopsis arenosa]|uniref:Uncharacterized protein n=1 Tax=Arabidopsis thaliana x Arabidopsis arenosa TaxID=1240361 RepID=A0A8T1XF47_9BRAS|nr:hypothetical protein ISN45_Un144g000020 [Arabidopsis thaliana x Arabidopsis arenosa]
MSSPAIYVSDNEDDSQGIPVPSGDEVFTQAGDKFGPYFRSQSTHASLAPFVAFVRPKHPDRLGEAGFSLTTSELLGLFRARDSASGNQTIPRPTAEFLSFFRIVSEGDTNWNSFTLQRIHGAGLAIKDGKTHPLDPPPEEKDVSSLNARDKRKIHAEIKALKDQLSEIGKKKRIAAISKVGSFHRKTLLVDDGSLEAALSSAVDSYGAISLTTPQSPPPFALPQEREREKKTPPLCTKRKAPDSDALSNERLKTVRLSSPLRAPSFLPSVFPSVESSDSELPFPGDRAIPEETDEPRPETFLSQGLSMEKRLETSSEVFKPGKGRPFLLFRFGGRKSVRCSSVEPVTYPRIRARRGYGFARRETNQKTELLIRNRARDIAEAEHNAREEMRGFGRQLIQSIMKFVKDEEVWTKLQSHRAELKSNLDLIGGIESGRISLEDERGEVSAELATVESELSSASRPSLDLGPFSLVFGDSPSQFEVVKVLGHTKVLQRHRAYKNGKSWRTGRVTNTEEGNQHSGSDRINRETVSPRSCQGREFINKLITRHDELEDEKKEIRKKRRELGKRCLDIARELHCLEAHPSDWIELGLQEYGNMSGCIMSIVDLAGQGAELGSPDALGPVSDEDDEDSSDGTNHLYVEDGRVKSSREEAYCWRDIMPRPLSVTANSLRSSKTWRGEFGRWRLTPKDWVRNGLERVGHIPEELREYCVTHDRRSCEVSSSEVENDQSPDIIRRVREDDFCFLGVFIAAGHAYKQSVYSNEVMRTANLHEIFENGEYANVESIYRHFLLTCLEYGNPTAKYMVSLRILTQVGPSQEALDLLVEDGKEILDGFLQRVDDLAEGVMIAKHVEREIDAMGLLGFRIFWDVFNHHNFPRFACYTIR